MRRFRLLLGAALVAGLLLAAAHPAQATFPGTNGKIAFSSNLGGSHDHYAIYTINPDGTGLSPALTTSGDSFRPAWSPDGTEIAFTSDLTASGNFDVYVMNADGSDQTRLTSNAADDGRPSWSPDGRKIAFRSDRSGDYEIYVMNDNGTHVTRLTTLTGFDTGPRYSRDGRRILFDHTQDPNGSDGPISVQVMDADGGNITQLTPDSLNAGPGDWSPHGPRIVFANNNCGTCLNSDIFVIDENGKHIRQLTSSFGNNLDPKWSPDGNQITFTHEDEPITFSHEQIYTMNADGSGRFNVTDNAFDNFSPDWGCGDKCKEKK